MLIARLMQVTGSRLGTLNSLISKHRRHGSFDPQSVIGNPCLNNCLIGHVPNATTDFSIPRASLNIADSDLVTDFTESRVSSSFAISLTALVPDRRLSRNKETCSMYALNNGYHSGTPSFGTGFGDRWSTRAANRYEVFIQTGVECDVFLKVKYFVA